MAIGSESGLLESKVLWLSIVVSGRRIGMPDFILEDSNDFFSNRATVYGASERSRLKAKGRLVHARIVRDVDSRGGPSGPDVGGFERERAPNGFDGDEDDC